MKIQYFITIILFVFISRNSFGQSIATNELGSIENKFVHIPDPVQTSVYWYWLSYNITKEGVVNDEEAMKKVGINRAFIDNIGLDNVPYGKVKMVSDEWWDILHAGLKGATLLKPTLTSVPANDSLNNELDNKLTTAIHLKGGQQFSNLIDTKRPCL